MKSERTVQKLFSRPHENPRQAIWYGQLQLINEFGAFMSVSHKFSAARAGHVVRQGVLMALMGVSLGACGGGDDQDEIPNSVNANRSMEVSGIVTAASNATTFTLEGVTVDAGAAVNTAGVIAVGSRIEAEGQLVDGVFRATRVEREDDQDFDGLEVWGSVEQLDTANQRFVVRGLTVRYGAARFEDGPASALANGRRVEVEGRTSADGRSMDAVRIDFED